LPAGIELDAAAREELPRFVQRRLEVMLRDGGHRADVVAATLAVHAGVPARAARTARVLGEHVARADWPATLTAYARCARIVRGLDVVPAQADEPPGEPDAVATLRRAVDAATYDLDRADALAVLEALAALAPEIDAFFESVLVMDPEPARRAHRLALVARIAALPGNIADLSQLEGF
jgi:glycyl-tRNA synthetase beta subunit